MRALGVVMMGVTLLGSSVARAGSVPVGASADPVAEAHNRFGFKLFTELCAGSPGKNVLISPVSIAFALGVAYNGAGGRTAQEMARCLELQGLDADAVNRGDAALLRSLQSKSSGVELEIATSLWADKRVKFRPAFLRQAASTFQAEVTPLDLNSTKAVERINAWVRMKTHAKIDGILDQPPNNAVLVIVNAVYFNGTWAQEFDVKATRDMDFTLADGRLAPRPMMSRTGTFPYYKGPAFQAVALPYKGEMVSFHVVLPDTGSSLADVVAGLDSAMWQHWTQKLEPSQGYVALPRFQMSYDLAMNEVLQTLGIQHAFSKSADFGAMADVRPLFITEVRHKSRIEVTERGTEAAATTSVRMTASAVVAPPTPFVLIADRPFLCAIRDRITGLVLFLGAVTDPRPVS